MVSLWLVLPRHYFQWPLSKNAKNEAKTLPLFLSLSLGTSEVICLFPTRKQKFVGKECDSQRAESYETHTQEPKSNTTTPCIAIREISTTTVLQKRRLMVRISKWGRRSDPTRKRIQTWLSYALRSLRSFKLRPFRI